MYLLIIIGSSGPKATVIHLGSMSLGHFSPTLCFMLYGQVPGIFKCRILASIALCGIAKAAQTLRINNSLFARVKQGRAILCMRRYSEELATLDGVEHRTVVHY